MATRIPTIDLGRLHGTAAEQQSLAMWGLNYVIEEYLPAKLRNTGAFLP